MLRTERPAIFADRDGTIIKDTGYPSDPQQVKLLPEVGRSLSVLQKTDYVLVIVSNQSGIGRGIITKQQAESVHQQVISKLRSLGIEVEGSYYCPHAPSDECDCRKPSPTMLLRAARELEVSLSDSFMIGDKRSDIEAGSRAGCKTILFGADANAGEHDKAPDLVASTWPQVAHFILENNSGR